MSYSSSPYAPRARRDAVNRIIAGESASHVAKSIGVNRATVYKWKKKREALALHGANSIPTLSSAPHSHPNAISQDTVEAIVRLREQTGRCAEIIHLELRDLDIVVSLSSVKRTLRRKGLTRGDRRWKRYRPPIPRPRADVPGALVEADTIHFMRSDGSRFYVFTLIDLYSRAAYAEYSPECTQAASIPFILRGQNYLGIPFHMVQTDNGGEFAMVFRQALHHHRIHLRHTRLGRPNDNAHIERFNRTIQEEMLSPLVNEHLVQDKIWRYLIYYNWQRRHLGINGKTPGQMLPWC